MDRKTPFLALLVLLQLLAGTACLYKRAQKLNSIEGITSYRLQNGMLVLLYPDDSKPKVTVSVTYKVGSKNEGYGESGMAHLLEHLLFMGSPKHPDLGRELREHGAQNNGTTSVDRTQYFETLNASDDNLHWALAMEADRMVNARVAEADLNKQMTVVRNEFEMGEDVAFRALLQRVTSAAYLWHPYGKSTIGARADIENVPIERLQEFYHKFYRPDRAVLVVAGKFDTDKTLKWIGDEFAPIVNPTRAFPTTSFTAEPAQEGERVVTLRQPGSQQILMAMYHRPSVVHPDSGPLQLLTSILGDAPGGRLDRALVENKMATSAFVNQSGNAEPGTLAFGAFMTKDRNLRDVEDRLLAEIEGFSNHPTTKEEFERARAKLLAFQERRLADSEEMGLLLGEYEAMGDWRLAFVSRDRLKKATLEDVTRVAQKYLKPSNRTMGLFIPTDKPDRAEIEASPAISTVVKDYQIDRAVQAEGEVLL